MKTLTIFGAKYRGENIATVYASSYGQANLLLNASTLHTDELEEFGPTLSPRKAGVELADGLDGLVLAISSPRAVTGKGIQQAVEKALRHGVKQARIRLAQCFASPDVVRDQTRDAFNVLKSQTAFRLDRAGELPGGYLTDQAAAAPAEPREREPATVESQPLSF